MQRFLDTPKRFYPAKPVKKLVVTAAAVGVFASGMALTGVTGATDAGGFKGMDMAHAGQK